jgi:hypothetical protein
VKGIPHPGCFAKRGWICLKTRELTFLETTKRRQEIGGKGDRGNKGGTGMGKKGVAGARGWRRGGRDDALAKVHDV